MKPKRTKQRRGISDLQDGRHTNGSGSDNDSNAEDIFTDEINEFTEARNKIDLGSDDSYSDEEEELFGLVSEGEEEGESDEELSVWSKRLKQVKFQARLDKKKSLPDAPEKSWGQKRTDFYGSGVRRKPKATGSDEEDEWVMEAKEIEKLQQKMDADMDEEDFLVPGLMEKASRTKGSDLKVKRDLPEKDKIAIQQQQHPEMKPLRDELSKCVAEVEALKDSKGWRLESRETVFRMLGAHIAFYLHLLETGEDTRGHPVLPRLLQWKKLAKLYESFGPECMASSGEDSDVDMPLTQDPTNKVRQSRRVVEAESEDSPAEGDDDITDGEAPTGEEMQNRPVTYEIEKNKEKKKSAPNNPRVKHREKFRKAKIRRRGKIRDYKPELTKYRGEASGIRSGIVRSVRIK